MSDTTRMETVYPATRWEDALPLGNGSLGALVYGNICSETIVVNHETLWADTPNPDVPEIKGALAEIRELLKQEKWKQADGVIKRKLDEKGYTPPHSDPYHPAFDIRIMSKPNALFTNYRRALDFATGVASISWQEPPASFSRECFVSRADDLICIRYKCELPNINCTINLQPRCLIEENSAYIGRQLTDDAIPLTFKCTHDNASLTISGNYTYRDAEFGGYARIILPGKGRIGPLAKGFSPQHRDSLTSGLWVTDADEILVLVKTYGYRMKEKTLEETQAILNATTDGYDTLLDRHVTLHRPAYNKLRLDLQSPDAEKENERLFLDGYRGGVSTALVEKMFNYGRYLLLASSSPGGWPANLQGLWNGDYLPAWSSDYHNDENVEMSYWPALPGNLQETLPAYFDFLEACVPDCQRNAKAHYGCRGIYAPISQDIKGRAAPSASTWSSWTAGAGWLAQPFYDYWLFTRDDEFLRDRAIPYLEQIALFYEDYLYEEDGKLVMAPSLSPENRASLADGTRIGFTSVNATMDVAVAKEVLTNLCEGCRHLDIKHDEVAKWEAMIGKMPEYETNEDGAIKEWIHPRLHDFYEHRHLSHLYPLFPGFEITKETHPSLYEACRVAVEKRRVVGQSAQSGWSLAHLANIYARLSDGDKALGCLETLIRSSVGPNLFTYHNDWRHMGLTLFWNFKDRLFQIDANFGLTAAVLEMLVYSTREMIGILPALPDKWPKGSFSGILCRAGAEVGASWDMPANALTVTLVARRTGAYTLRFPRAIVAIDGDASDRISASPLGDNCRSIVMQAGASIKLTVRLQPKI